MAKKPVKSRLKRGAVKPPAGRAASPSGKEAVVYKHEEEKLLLRPDVGLQAQFRKKKPPKTYRYDPSLDPGLSWDINAGRERGEALIARIESATALDDAKAAAAELKRMSRPFLNWTGKAERHEFSVPTLPLFVHERLSTQAILRSMKSHKRDRQQTLDLFADEELDVTDRLLKAYEHPTNWVNRLILGDSLIVMNSLLEYESLGGQVQMIYMDPPYGVRFGSNFQPFVRKRDVKHGDDGDMTREPEMVQAYRDTWEIGLHSYLAYLRDRCALCHRLLSRSGSMFVQIGDENVHHAREILDEIFGAENFISLVTFQKTTGSTGDYLSGVTDYILFYAKDKTQLKYRSVYLDKEISEEVRGPYSWIEFLDGSRRRMTTGEREDISRLPNGTRIFRLDNLQSQSVGREKGEGAASWFPVAFEGREFRPTMKTRWKTNEDGMARLRQARRLHATETGLYYVRYVDDFPARPLTNDWNDTVIAGFASRKAYVVETSTKALQRCLLMATDPGDLVLDPTCGSGTTAYVAESWGRRWITVDASRVPLALARQRLLSSVYPFYELRDTSRGPAGGFVFSRRRNQRGEEVGGIVPHVMLEQIAKGQASVEEVLVDRPDRIDQVVRVTGPFVVEATIPAAVELEPVASRESTARYGDAISRMLEVLRKSPTLRIARDQTVTLNNIRRPAKALSIHAEADMDTGGRPVALAFGPEDGPVTEHLVFNAAREANLKSYERLFVIGFGIQPGASKLIQNCEAMAGIPATYVQATMDLLMGDLLKTTRASQIFSVTGTPDVRLVTLKRKNGNGPLYQVELLGLDVFDPVTMQNEHRKGDDVPAWFLDSDYDDLVFRVSQAFFPRTSAWDALKRALKGAYDDAVWDHLAGTTSEPFSAGEHQRVAVKVIDDRGNELIVVRPLSEAEPER